MGDEGTRMMVCTYVLQHRVESSYCHGPWNLPSGLINCVIISEREFDNNVITTDRREYGWGIEYIERKKSRDGR